MLVITGGPFPPVDMTCLTYYGLCLQVGFGWVGVGTVAMGMFGFALIISVLFSCKPNKHRKYS